MQSVELTLASLALYGTILFAPGALLALAQDNGRLGSWPRSSRPWLYAALAAAMLGVLLLVVRSDPWQTGLKHPIRLRNR